MVETKETCILCEKELRLLEKDYCDSCWKVLEAKYPNEKLLAKKIKEHKKHSTKFQEDKK